eukprot:GFYU01005959.1.p1 GENE.GFYU01005959.1~~GFYU01005959.1.p1  ORF type:complete len:316 (+),score=37.31 GFYU01005959.1:288-1235(+)
MPQEAFAFRHYSLSGMTAGDIDPQDPDADHSHFSCMSPPYLVSNYVLSASYLIIVVVSAIQYYRFSKHCTQFVDFKRQKLFHVLIFMHCAIRASFFIVNPYGCDWDCWNGYCSFVMNSFPGVLFLSINMLLVFFWADLFYQAYQHSSMESVEKRRHIFVAMNVLLYLADIIFLVLYVVYEDSDVRWQINFGFAIMFACVSLAVGFGFVFFGLQLFMSMRKIPVHSKRKFEKMRKIGWVTVVFSIALTTRALFVLYVDWDMNAALDYYWVWFICYYLMLDVCPCGLLLIILRKIPKKRAPLLAYSDISEEGPDYHQ